jgi:hypothetical protein
MTGWLGKILLAATLLSGGAMAADFSDDQFEQADPYVRALRLMSEGRQEEAQALLQRLVELMPEHAGARLDLAIMQCALGHQAEAERLFREVEERFAPAPAILEVISLHRKQGCQGRPLTRSTVVTLSRGTDNNINQGASSPFIVIGSGTNRVERELSPEFLPQADQYSQFALDHAHELNRKGTLVIAQFRARRNDSLHEQDINALLLALEQPLKSGNWDLRGSASVSAVTLAGKLYQRQNQFQVRAAPPLPLPQPLQLTFMASLGHISYPHRVNFDSDIGELGMLLTHQGSTSATQFSFGRLVDHGSDARLGGNRHGFYSSIQAQTRLNSQFDLEMGLSRQDWHGQTIYSPGLLDDIRNQSTLQARLALDLHLSAAQSLQLEWRQVKNRENISLFKYNSRMLQLNWRWNGSNK